MKKCEVVEEIIFTLTLQTVHILISYQFKAWVLAAGLQLLFELSHKYRHHP
jgi:hypothetical protein